MASFQPRLLPSYSTKENTFKALFEVCFFNDNFTTDPSYHKKLRLFDNLPPTLFCRNEEYLTANERR